MTAFGKFPSLGAFLVACEDDRRKREQEADLSPATRTTRRRRDHDVVEVDCKIAEVMRNDTHGAKHVRLHVELTDVIESDADVDDDVQSDLKSHQYVLVVIQYGDRHGGTAQPIPGLIEGADIRVRGAWITAEHAYAVGGEKLSVLHFTHSPVGFVMVGGIIYR